MRKQLRKKKREQTAAQANNPSMQQMPAWNRASMSSSSSAEFDRRDSSISLAPSDFGRASAYSNHGLIDSRPSTAGSMMSVTTDGRPSTGYASATPWAFDPATRRVSAPTHISIPQRVPQNGYRPAQADHPTPTPQNPFPQMSQNGRQYFQQQTLTAPMASTSQLNGSYEQFAFR